MNQQLQNQLNKILAMADSSHDGEAVVAVRKARQVLSRNGLSFADLARAASHKQRRMPFPFFASSSVDLELELLELRQQLRSIQNDLQMQTAESELWRQRSSDLEQKLCTSQTEAKRWRQLARDTVEKLWDLGQAVGDEELNADEAMAKSA
jgi:hypothetical protein